MDWTTLLGPVIITVVPVLVTLVRQVVPASWTWLFPLLATALGPLLDWVSLQATGVGHGAAAGALYGMAGVALREMQDQVRKAVGLRAP